MLLVLWRRYWIWTLLRAWLQVTSSLVMLLQRIHWDLCLWICSEAWMNWLQRAKGWTSMLFRLYFELLLLLKETSISMLRTLQMLCVCMLTKQLKTSIHPLTQFMFCLRRLAILSSIFQKMTKMLFPFMRSSLSQRCLKLFKRTELTLLDMSSKYLQPWFSTDLNLSFQITFEPSLHQLLTILTGLRIISI